MARNWEVLSTMPDHDLPASAIPMEMNPYRLRQVVGDPDLQMPEHLYPSTIVGEGSSAAHRRVRHDDLRFLGCVLVLPKHQACRAVASVQQASTVLGY